MPTTDVQYADTQQSEIYRKVPGDIIKGANDAKEKLDSR